MKALLISFVAVAILVLNLAATPGAQNPSKGWHTVTDGSFTFQLPDEMTSIKNIGNYDGHMRTFSGKRIPLFTLNYRATTCDTATISETKPGVERSMIDVNGRKGMLITGPSPDEGQYRAAICFDNVDGEGRRLRFSAVCVDREALELAKEIFRTVEIRSP